MRWAMIGVGNMGEALLRGLVRAGVAAAGDVFAVDPRGEATASLARELGVVTGSLVPALAAADVVVLAVKPQTMAAVLAALGPHVRPGQVVISIAAGVTLARIEAALPPGVAVVRAMPNTPCLIGAGASAYALGTSAGPDAAALAQALLEAVGLALQVDEAHLDAVTALSGSGPAYIFALLEAMVAGGERAGLPPEVTARLARQTVLGAARLAAESNVEPAELRRRVTSPGGTTAAALAVMQARGWHDAMVDAIVAARDRGAELGKA